MLLVDLAEFSLVVVHHGNDAADGEAYLPPHGILLSYLLGFQVPLLGLLGFPEHFEERQPCADVLRGVLVGRDAVEGFREVVVGHAVVAQRLEDGAQPAVHQVEVSLAVQPHVLEHLVGFLHGAEGLVVPRVVEHLVEAYSVIGVGVAEGFEVVG